MAFSIFGKKKKKEADSCPEEDIPEEQSEETVDPEPSETEIPLSAPPETTPADAPAEDLPDPVTGKEETSSDGLFGKLRKGLAKTREILTTDVDDLLLGRKIDDDLLEDLEELLITADIGVETALAIVERIRGLRGRIQSGKDLKAVLQEELLREIETTEMPEPAQVTGNPHVILVVGVNGVGKTTTIGKLAARFAAEGKKVMVAAGDTFRAAAVEQLALWADRAGSSIVKHKENTDPAAVAFDALDSAIAKNADVVIVDTAGRLHNKVNLMEELKKIQRTLQKRMPEAPHETLLVVDATTGQNAIRQAELFHASIGLSGLVLTKLDGTAKGGIVVAIRKQFGLPIRYVGVGEGMDDLQPFDADAFFKAMF